MAKYSEKQNKWTQDYIKKAYDEIKIRVPKGKKDEYKAKLEEQGISLNKFVADYLERELG